MTIYDEIAKEISDYRLSNGLFIDPNLNELVIRLCKRVARSQVSKIDPRLLVNAIGVVPAATAAVIHGIEAQKEAVLKELE